ncbi:DUF222 domain-containing protein [Nakamurella sp. YIM 132087]|uniref:DUF222 domain-containing protein n=1 Tax=Nakamurella alba TaxID=2665158 RepID=A0A7K1FQY6_9ACTN|nr:DUF222 domain-containing protein [Nakamurella alba]MTD16480.1 DUF222 domain-containing protein [Nakamurella alba]
MTTSGAVYVAADTFDPDSDLVVLADMLRQTARSASDNWERINHIRWLTQIAAVCAAEQARLTDQFARAKEAAVQPSSQRAKKELRSTTITEIGLARRESPSQARHHLGLADALSSAMPHLRACLDRGEISEHRAVLITRAASKLSPADRSRLDEKIAPDLPHLGDAETSEKANAIAYELDPELYAARRRKAVSDRRVSLTPAKDGMCWFSALLPAAQGLALHAHLQHFADLDTTDGDTRTRDQKLADELVRLGTGGNVFGCDEDGVPVNLGVRMEIRILMGERALLDDDSTAAYIEGYGPVPADLARKMVGASSQTWIRRLYTDPVTGRLDGMDQRRRDFPDSIKMFLQLRDRRCRTPWCDAPIRHFDHIVGYAIGGETSVENGEGTCAFCDINKAGKGWSYSRNVSDGVITVTTPTGHTYRSVEPSLPAPKPWPTAGVQCTCGAGVTAQ